MSHTVLDGSGTLRYVRSLGTGTAGDPLRLVFFSHDDADVDDGLVFTHSDRHTLANNGILYYLLRIPAAPAHIELHGFSITTDSSPVYCDLYEGAIVSNTGTVEPFHNNNRNSATTSQVALYESPTVTSQGTLLIASEVSGDKTVGGTTGVHKRRIFKNSTDHLLRFENKSGGTAIFSITLVIGED